MILRSPTEDENGRSLALTVILNAVKDLLYVFDPLETDNKQILRRCAPQNDIATSPQGDGLQPQFSKEGFTDLFQKIISRLRCAVSAATS
jgi:hypothetical protein